MGLVNEVLELCSQRPTNCEVLQGFMVEFEFLDDRMRAEEADDAYTFEGVVDAPLDYERVREILLRARANVANPLSTGRSSSGSKPSTPTVAHSTLAEVDVPTVVPNQVTLTHDEVVFNHRDGTLISDISEDDNDTYDSAQSPIADSNAGTDMDVAQLTPELTGLDVGESGLRLATRIPGPSQQPSVLLRSSDGERASATRLAPLDDTLAGLDSLDGQTNLSEPGDGEYSVRVQPDSDAVSPRALPITLGDPTTRNRDLSSPLPQLQGVPIDFQHATPDSSDLESIPVSWDTPQAVSSAPSPNEYPQIIVNPKSISERALAAAEATRKREAKFQCHICYDCYTTKSNLDNHIISRHMQLKRFPCPFPGCSAKYGHARGVNRHLDTKHPGFRQSTPRGKRGPF